MMPDESMGLELIEEYTLEKIHTGELEPYEVVRIHADGTRSVWRRSDDAGPPPAEWFTGYSINEGD